MLIPSQVPHYSFLDVCKTCREYEMQVADGRVIAGGQGSYHGQPSGLAYGAHPAENVVFNGCHDNETIFDQVRCVYPQHKPALCMHSINGT